MGFLAVLNLTALDEGEEAFLFLFLNCVSEWLARGAADSLTDSFPGQ